MRMLGNDNVFQLPHDEIGKAFFPFIFFLNKAETPVQLRMQC